MKKLKEEDLRSIFKLLMDPDEKVFELLRTQLIENTEEHYPLIKKELETNSNNLVCLRLSNVLEQLKFKKIEEEFKKIPVLENGDIDLEEASFILASFGYPEIEPEIYKKQLDVMAETIKVKIQNIKEPALIIEKINKFLFHEEGFTGNQDEYMDDDNTFINKVLERKTGIPITLSLVYLLLAKRLSLPFYGVSMPGHFILKYKQDEFETFIDPFHEGQVLSKQDCINFLLFSGYGYLDRYIEVSSNKDIFKRMIRNLLLIYKEENNDDKYDRLRNLLNIVETYYK